ncbi:MAG: carboxylesterase family protein [Treponema sp.]|jgi:para-nitrobenzyl esterase|nr:carboxylesterase family protein [Treponema sp.]
MARQFLCAAGQPAAETKAGKLRGFMLDGVYAFHGIKYAEAERFGPPGPVAAWEGLKDALSYGYIAPLLEHPAPQGEVMIPHRFWPEHESCFYLNVWTLHLDRAAKRPVMVWLHGGGFSAGSSIEQVAYEGDNLCKYGDVVVVSLNHRLNILGYLDLSSYGEKYKNSGNAGMADIVEALRWIQDNIAAFGGDPDNVTVFGQSGGGMKVTALGQIPEAKGLYHKGIVMSGVADTGIFGGKRDDRRLVKAMLEELNFQEREVEKLETIPFAALARAFKRASRKLAREGISFHWGPVDNDWYLGDPLQKGFTEAAKKIPLMVGTVIAEFAFGPGVPGKRELSRDARRGLIAARFGAYADELISLFAKAYPGKNETDLLSLDCFFRPGTLKYIEKKSAEGSAPVYSYMFALEFDYDGGKPAWHCSDIPFVFRNSGRVAVCNIPGVTEKLEEEVAGAYVNFASRGNPNHPALSEWPAYTPENKATMVFDRDSQVRFDHEGDLLALLAKASPPFKFSPGVPQDDEEEEAEKAWLY